MTETAAVVADNATRRRFEVAVDGEVAGFSEYHDRGNRRSFTHTEIDPAYEGQGLGSTLVEAVLQDARSHGLEVLPFCPFVRDYIERHREFVDLVPQSERPRFRLDAPDER